MKHITFLLLVLCSALSVQANKHLIELNPEWLNQTDIDVRNVDFVPRDHQDLIQKHLLLVEQTLRSRSTDHLTTDQKAKRDQCLDILHEYALAGAFPQNNAYSYLTPIFVDDNQVYCAVGHLMKETGHASIAQWLDSQNELVFVKDIKNVEAAQWMQDYGLSLDECAWIQPGYLGPKVTIDDVPLDLSGLSPTSPIVNRLLDTATNLTFSATMTSTVLGTGVSGSADGSVWLEYDASGNRSQIDIQFSDTATRLIVINKEAVIDTNNAPVLGTPGSGVWLAQDTIMVNNAAINFFGVVSNGIYHSGYVSHCYSPFSTINSVLLAKDFVTPYDTFKFDDPSNSGWGADLIVFDYIGQDPQANYTIDVVPTSAMGDGAVRLVLTAITDNNSPITVSADDITYTLDSDDQGVHIRWTDPAYDQTVSYQIERSTDYTDWQVISGDILSENGDGEYSYLDTEPNRGMNYYRIALNSVNGHKRTTQVQSISVEEKASPVYSALEILGSNQVSSELKIIYKDELNGSQIQIFDVQGKLHSIPTDQQPNQATLNTSSLSSGLYFVRMGDHFARFVKK